MNAKGKSANIPATLPATGFSRWENLKHFIPVSRETWRKLVKEGRAPQPQRWTNRCTVYSNEEVHQWMENPMSYKASPVKEAATMSTAKKVKISPFNASEYLDSEEAIASYINSAMESDDQDVLLLAISDVAKARGMGKVAEEE